MERSLQICHASVTDIRPRLWLWSLGGRSRRPEPGAAAGGGGGARARLHPRRRRLRQDDDDHPADRVAGRVGCVPGRRDPRGDVHRQGRGGDEGQARRARRGGRRRADVPLRSARRSSIATRPARSAGSCRRRRSSSARSRTRCRGRTGSGPRATSRPRSSGRRTSASARTAYLASLGEHEPPIPPDLMATVYREYERRKATRGELDFEDVLELAVRLLRDRRARAVELRERYRAFTVDEYQDVNLLQQALLDLWLGPRDDLCVVGDDYQSIYAFTGASPRWLLGMRERFPDATVARLEENYRSSPEVLALANRLVPRLGGAEKVLRATQPGGPEPVTRSFVTSESEDAWLAHELDAARAARASRSRRRRSSAARTRAWPTSRRCCTRRGSRSRARRCWGARRRGGCCGCSRATARPTSPAASATLAEEAGWLREPPERLGERELTRQADLGRLVRLAEELDDGGRPAPGSRRSCGAGSTPAATAARGRPPADLPPREGARVRRRLPAPARRQGAAVEARPNARGARRGAAAPLRRDDAGAGGCSR